MSPELVMMSWDALIKMRATKPNLLMRPKQWDSKMEDMMSKTPSRFCVNMGNHEKPHFSTVEDMEQHKDTCWEEQKLRMERDLHNV